MYQIETIANLIEESGLATVGQDLFLYYCPPEVKQGVILQPSYDPPILDPDTPDYLKAKFQVIVRSAQYQPGLVLAKGISDYLTQFNVQTPEITIKYVRPLYQPRVYRRSDSGLIETSVTFEIRYILK